MLTYRIKLSNQTEKGLVVDAATEERARELALEWANDPTVTIISCKLMMEDEIYVAEGDRWTPKEKGRA